MHSWRLLQPCSPTPPLRPQNYAPYFNTPMTFTFIMTLKATSVTHCLLKCNLETGCFVVKVASIDDVTGEVECHLYKADDTNTSISISDFYIKL